ncbi:MAG: VWA domain-containing protein [Puniceicoccales bacterium]
MNFSVLYPWFFALLPLAILFWFWQRESLSDLPLRRRRISTTVRISLFTLLVLALSDPRLLLEKNQTQVVIVADASDSLGQAALEKVPDYQDLPDDLPRSLILFAGNTEVSGFPEDGSPPLPGPLDPSRTRIAEALRFAEATVPSGRAPTLVLISDGQGEGHNFSELAEEFANRGIRIHTIPIDPTDKPEVLVRSMMAPSEANPQEPFSVEVEVVSNREGDAHLEIFRNGALSAERELNLQPGSNRFSFTERASQEGVVALTASIRPPEGMDTFLDNNQLTAHVRTGNESKILLISDKPEALRYLSRALRQEGFQLDIRPPSGIPQSMPELESFGLVVFDNIPATDPSTRQMSLIHEYVRDFGGGFLMIGGENSFGLGGYFDTPIDEILPVQSDFEKDKETPSLAVALVIDRSGSMSGEKIEMVKAASEATVNLLSPRDYAGVVAFDSQAFWVSDLQSASNQHAIIRQIRQLTASGGTNISPGLELAHRALASNPAKLKHVILLTDGQSMPGPFYEQTSRMAREGITVSTVAVGNGADRALLEQIAKWGNGRFHFTADPRKVVQIFARETVTASRSAIQELPFLPVSLRSADFLDEIPFDSAPFLLGFVSTEPKATADLWLATETGEPLLATWRFGLGKAGAFTSDARNRWAIDWLRWPSFGKFWAGIFRHLERESDLGAIPAQIQRRGDRLFLSAEAVGRSGGILPDAAASLRLLLPSGESEELSLESSAPGMFSVDWPAESGTHMVRLILEKDGETIGSRTLFHDVGYSDEYSLKPAHREGLAELAAATGGKINPSLQDLQVNDRSVQVESELWPWLLIAALFLFLFDVTLKRFPHQDS